MFALNVRDTIFCALLLSWSPYQCIARVFLETVACCQSEIFKIHCYLPVNILRSAPRKAFYMESFMDSWNPSWGQFPWKSFTPPWERFEVSISPINSLQIWQLSTVKSILGYANVCHRRVCIHFHGFGIAITRHQAGREEQITIVKVQKNYLSLFVPNFLGAIACDNVDSCTCFWDG